MSDAQMDTQINSATSTYQGLQNELQTLVETRQKLGAQLAENESVKGEFALLTPNNTVFKLIGGCLVKQEQQEAKSNVDKRIEFIGSEIEKLEANLKSVQEKSEVVKMEIVRLRTLAQGSAQPSA